MKYKDSSINIQERVEHLISIMTLDEKLAQLSSTKMGDIMGDLSSMSFSEELASRNIPCGCGYIARIGGASDLQPVEIAELTNRIQRFFVEKTRLGIPVIFMTEATSGVLSRNHTLFPQNIGAGAMFNEDLIFEMGNAIRKEMLSTGERWALAPVVDVIRDHRYGRYEESYGEDVYLVTQCGKAYTKGLQSESLKNGIAATLKHFLAQGISDGGRNCAPIHLGEREMMDQYAVPFEAAIKDANAASVMAAYHEIDGIPCHVHSKLLKDLLRDYLGFEGVLMSDGNGIQLVKTFHDYCEKLEDTVPLTLNAGIELELDYIYKTYLKDLVLNGQVDSTLIDNAVRRVLSLKFKLGLFDKPYVDVKMVEKTVCCEAHKKISAEMARQSMTLLKNQNGILPLSSNIGSIAVIGPLAACKDFAYSDYSYPSHIEDMYYQSEGLSEEEAIARTLFFKKKETRYDDLFHDTKTIYQAIMEKVSKQTKVHYASGLKDTYNYYNDPEFYSLEEAMEAAGKADIVIAVCGDTSGMGRENDSGESVDRVEIGLSKEQRRLLMELKKLGKPIILVLCNGRPLELTYESQEMDAILEAWRPGMTGAEAIADVLFGDYNPSGRLPVTLPKCIGQLPVYYSQRSTGKRQFWRETYLETDLKPLYPFGFGLSYTKFEYRNILMNQSEDGISVSVTVANTGDCDGEEVIQVYARKRFTSVKQPEQELKDFKRVSIKKGEEVVILFYIHFDSLGYHNLNNQLVLENCMLDIIIGSTSEDIKAEETFNLSFPEGMRKVERRVFTNTAIIKNK